MLIHCHKAVRYDPGSLRPTKRLAFHGARDDESTEERKALELLRLWRVSLKLGLLNEGLRLFVVIGLGLRLVVKRLERLLVLKRLRLFGVVLRLWRELRRLLHELGLFVNELRLRLLDDLRGLFEMGRLRHRLDGDRRMVLHDRGNMRLGHNRNMRL